MALNPEIALGFRSPQVNLDVPSPIHQMGQMMTLRGLMEQQQLRRSQIEQEQFKLESLRQANAGQQEFQRRALAGENLTQGQTLGYLGPKLGTDFLKGQSELEEQRFKQNAERMKQLGSIIGSATDTPTFTRAVMEAHSQGYFNPEQARQFLQGGYDPARVKQYRDWAMTAEQQNTAEMNRLKADREAKESAARVASEEAQGRLRGLEYAAQTAPNDPARWAEWRSQIGQTNPEALPLIPPQHSPAAYQLVRQFGTKPTAPQVAMTPERLEQEVKLRAPQPQPGMSQERFNQELQLRASGAAAGRKEDAIALADTVIANPSLWDQLTPSAKTNTAPVLAQKGYKDFGKPMNEGALTKIAESRSAIESLRDLRVTLKENEQYIGPISGFQALNPYSEARQAQAKIDLVKQRVGKALEGGVLRKEDEEKYKRILATLRDTPATAIAKVDGLVETLQRDMKIFEDEQRRGGRRVPERPAESTPSTAPTAAPKAPPAVGTVKDGYRFLGGDPGSPNSWRLVLTVK